MFYSSVATVTAPNPSAQVDWEAAAKCYSEARQPNSLQRAMTEGAALKQVAGDTVHASDAPQQEDGVQENGHLTGKKRRTFAALVSEAARETQVPLPTTPDAEAVPAEEHPGGDDDERRHNEAQIQNEDALSCLLKKVDQNPHDYEASHQLVAALAQTDRLDEYEAALERMLREFPLLFGYWKKLGRLYVEKKRGWPQIEQVLERACEYVGHNPMIWVAYLQWVKESCCMTTDATRIVIDRALDCAGLHWKAWPLWQAALDFEEEEYKQACVKVAFTGHTDGAVNAETSSDLETRHKENKETLSKHALLRRSTALDRLRRLYFRLHATPLESLDLGWERFKSFVGREGSGPVSRFGTYSGAKGEEAQEAVRHVEILDLLTDDELLQLRSNLLKQKRPGDDDEGAQAEATAGERAPGAEGEGADPQGVRQEVSTLGSQNAVEEACWAIRHELFSRTTEQAERCKAFENGVHRWFWHPDPLTPQRLEAWRDYLDYEDQRGDRDRKAMLQKRCLEVCASYLEFWQHFARVLMEDGKSDSALELLHRGAYQIMPRRRDFALAYALLAEELQKFTEAAETYNRLLEPPLSPAYLKYYLAWIDFQRRRGELDRALQLYDEGLQRFASHQQCCELLHLLKARFLFFVHGDLKASVSCLTKAAEAYPQNVCVLQLLVRLIETKHAGDPAAILASLSTHFADSLKDTEVNVWAKWQIWKMYVHVLESYAEDITRVQAAKTAAFRFLRSNREALLRAAPDAFRLHIPEALRTEISLQRDDGKTAFTASAPVPDNAAMSWNNGFIFPGYDATACPQTLQHQAATAGGVYDGYQYWEPAGSGARGTGYYTFSDTGQGGAVPFSYYITATSTASSTPSMRSRSSV